jgi:hypothetical protein
VRRRDRAPRRAGSSSPAAIRRREGGQALLFALIVLLVLGLSLALLALSMRVRLEEQQREVRRVRLAQLLDGVVAETLAQLARDPRFGGIAQRSSPAGGEASSEVAPVTPRVVRIEAAARLGPRRARVTVVAEVLPGPPRILRWRRGGGSG